jgi:hypothetical protein
MRREPVIVNDCRVSGDTLHGLHFIRDGGFFTGKFMKAAGHSERQKAEG